MCRANRNADRWTGETHTHTHIFTAHHLLSDTDFDIGAFGLHQFTDDFAELVSI